VKISKWSQPLDFSVEQMFDLAAGIEDYPRFLRGWIEVRVLERTAEDCHVEQVLGFGPMRLRFRSRGVLHRPKRIDVSSTEAPFRHFSLAWQFEPAGSGCRVRIEMDVQLLSRLTQALVERILPAEVDEFMSSFEARARQIYAPHGSVR
jgi:coenzyme Q-binding protein COQ10